MSRIIDADKLSADMYHEAFEKDSDMQKWDSGCWIRYKMFENVLKAQPTVVEAPDINVGNMDTTTYDSIPAETGENDGDGTSGDCISRRASLEKIRTMQTYKLFAGDDMLLIDQAEAQTELMMLPPVQPERKTGRWIEMSSTNHTYKCSECGRLLVNVTDGKNNVSKHYPYCHCGAKMEEGREDE